ncbi:MAG: phasin family protein [Magnetococcus sp. DMHC-6]
MENIIPEKMAEVTKNVLDSVLRMQEISDKTMQNLAKQQMAVAQSCMEAGVKQIRKASDARDVRDAVGSQADLTQELGELMINHARQTMELLTSGRDEIKTLVEKKMNDMLAMGKVK